MVVGYGFTAVRGTTATVKMFINLFAGLFALPAWHVRRHHEAIPEEAGTIP
jgi:hypothetical protein